MTKCKSRHTRDKQLLSVNSHRRTGKQDHDDGNLYLSVQTLTKPIQSRKEYVYQLTYDTIYTIVEEQAQNQIQSDCCVLPLILVWCKFFLHFYSICHFAFMSMYHFTFNCRKQKPTCSQNYYYFFFLVNVKTQRCAVRLNLAFSGP